jgi:leucyl aminopeptidase (aminopeptidase T)
MPFDLEKLLGSVFETERGETVVVACDLPTPHAPDSPAWADRRKLAAEWRDAFERIGRRAGFTTRPLLTFPATGASGADLPTGGTMAGADVAIDQVLLEATLACFLTEYSATAALDGYTRRKADFRAASLPGLERRMEGSALAADYREVARRCHILEEILDGAESLDVRFSTGHTCAFDLRFRKPEADDGYLPRRKKGDRIINLPSGETFIVPYEGEQSALPSRTAGIIPVARGGEIILLRIDRNRVADVIGDGREAEAMRLLFAIDGARTNIAEVAFGCNDHAVVTGNVLEDEKAGFHWAYGRSDHLGGTVGVAAFADRANVVHHDIVYARGNPIIVAEATVRRAGARPTTVMRDGAYLVF